MSGFLTDIENDLRSVMAAEFSQTFSIQLPTILLEGLKGIFDSTFLEVDEEGANVQSTSSQLGTFIKTVDDLLGAELTEEDKPVILIGADEYILSHIERDGTGYARMILKKNE